MYEEFGRMEPSHLGRHDPYTELRGNLLYKVSLFYATITIYKCINLLKYAYN